jgi:hypothetical protein
MLNLFKNVEGDCMKATTLLMMAIVVALMAIVGVYFVIELVIAYETVGYGIPPWMGFAVILALSISSFQMSALTAERFKDEEGDAYD